MTSAATPATTPAAAALEPTPGTKDSQVSLRLPGELKDRIERYAQMTGRSKSFVAVEALTEYLDWRLPQLQDLEQAIAAADRGEFATDAAVATVFKRYGVDTDAAGAAAAPATAHRSAKAAAPKPKRA